MGPSLLKASVRLVTSRAGYTTSRRSRPLGRRVEESSHAVTRVVSHLDLPAWLHGCFLSPAWTNSLAAAPAQHMGTAPREPATRPGRDQSHCVAYNGSRVKPGGTNQPILGTDPSVARVGSCTHAEHGPKRPLRRSQFCGAPGRRLEIPSQQSYRRNSSQNPRGSKVSLGSQRPPSLLRFLSCPAGYCVRREDGAKGRAPLGSTKIPGRVRTKDKPLVMAGKWLGRQTRVQYPVCGCMYFCFFCVRMSKCLISKNISSRHIHSLPRGGQEKWWLSHPCLGASLSTPVPALGPLIRNGPWTSDGVIEARAWATRLRCDNTKLGSAVE